MDEIMTRHKRTDSHGVSTTPPQRLPWGYWGLLALAVLFLWQGNAYLLAALPLVVLLGCPLTHLWTHHGHGLPVREEDGDSGHRSPYA